MTIADVLVDAFGRIEEEVVAVLAGLDAIALAFRPDADANSIAWLAWHLTRVQDDHVSEIAGIDQAYVVGGWAARFGRDPDPSDTGYGHTSEQVEQLRIEHPDLLTGYHQAVAARTRAYLRTIEPDDLDRIIDERWNPPVSVGVRLVSVIADCLQHVGQAAYIRGLYERIG